MCYRLAVFNLYYWLFVGSNFMIDFILNNLPVLIALIVVKTIFLFSIAYYDYKINSDKVL